MGFALGFVLMVAIVWACRGRSPSRLSRAFRRLQIASAGFMALSHGSNDAQKTMGIIAMSLALYSGESQAGAHFHVPLWVMVACAVAMGAGTMAGGVRIIKTMGTKIIELKPVDGFAAETSAARDNPGSLAPGYARLDDARAQRGDHGGRFEPAGLGGAVGGDGADHVGLGSDDPGQRGGGVGLLPASSSGTPRVNLAAHGVLTAAPMPSASGLRSAAVTLLTAAISRARSTGLVRCSVNPAARLARTSSSEPYPLIAIARQSPQAQLPHQLQPRPIGKLDVAPPAGPKAQRPLPEAPPKAALPLLPCDRGHRAPSAMDLRVSLLSSRRRIFSPLDCRQGTVPEPDGGFTTMG